MDWDLRLPADLLKVRLSLSLIPLNVQKYSLLVFSVTV